MWWSIPLFIFPVSILIFLIDACISQFFWCKKNKKGFWKTFLWGREQYEKEEVQEEVQEEV